MCKLWYFNLRLSYSPEFTFWNIKGLHDQVAKKEGLESFSLWQKLIVSNPKPLNLINIRWSIPTILSSISKEPKSFWSIKNSDSIEFSAIMRGSLVLLLKSIQQICPPYKLRQYWVCPSYKDKKIKLLNSWNTSISYSDK